MAATITCFHAEGRQIPVYHWQLLLLVVPATWHAIGLSDQEESAQIFANLASRSNSKRLIAVAND